MRCFIAIDIDKKTKDALSDLQQQLRSKADIKKNDVKWVKPEAMHLTLKFLGEVEDDQIVDVCKAVQQAAAEHSSFELDIESVGCFGGRNARVLWVGTGLGSEQLCQLQKDLEDRLAQAGWPKEKRQFSGHLTLCRIKNPKAAVKLIEISRNYRDFKAGTILADSLRVYHSRLTPTGPVYTLLAKYKLSGNNF